MKYTGMPMGMWVPFSGSFRKQLTAVLKYDGEAAKRIRKQKPHDPDAPWDGYDESDDTEQKVRSVRLARQWRGITI